MISPAPSITMPDNITAPIAFEAADFITQLADWRIVQTGADPLTFDIEWDDVFADAFEFDGSWQTRDYASAHIAQWITNLIRKGLTKASIRRMSLQVPQEAQAEPFLAGLKERVCIALSDALRAHYDQSLKQWERDARTCAGLIQDPVDQDRFRTYVGLDQVVSEDAARKAVKFLTHRTGWALQGNPDDPELVTNWQFEMFLSRRNSEEEAMRARSLVARSIEAIFADNSRRRMQGQPVKAVTRSAITDLIQQRFSREGPWALIHFTLDQDRSFYGLQAPSDPVALNLIERQRPRLFRVWAPEQDF